MRALSISEHLDRLIHLDFDEVLAKAHGYNSIWRLRLIRAASQRYSTLTTSADRMKAVWALQALLASTEDLRLPTKTSIEVARTLADITKSPEERPEARHRALDSLALVFVKTKTLPESLDSLIRTTFTAASRSSDRYLSDFAAEALSGEGVLARRGPMKPVLIDRVSIGRIAGRRASVGKTARRDLSLPVVRRNGISSRKRHQ